MLSLSFSRLSFTHLQVWMHRAAALLFCDYKQWNTVLIKWPASSNFSDKNANITTALKQHKWHWCSYGMVHSKSICRVDGRAIEHFCIIIWVHVKAYKFFHLKVFYSPATLGFLDVSQHWMQSYGFSPGQEQQPLFYLFQVKEKIHKEL